MLHNISYVLWNLTTLFIIISAIYLSFYHRFVHFKWSKRVKQSDKYNRINSIKLLNLTLAGKIGVGSISGIAFSIIIGGKGTIFWIWISSLFFSIFNYLEVKAGIKYGGPHIYIEKRLKNKKLSIIYSILIIITFLISFIMIQSNTIITMINNSYSINTFLIMFFLIILFIISSKNGINTISKVVSFIVPIMGLFYFFIGLYVTIINKEKIINILINIFLDAFKIKSIFVIPLIIGFQRSIFCNESGMGSTSMVASLSNNKDYLKEAKIQLIGMYYITLVICTISSFIILTTNYEQLNISNINSIEIINYAFYYHFGLFGRYISSIIISMFAFSTIITSYYYGDISLKYLLGNKNNIISKIIVIIVIVLSLFVGGTNIWAIVDITTALTTIINVYSLIKIRKDLRN